MTAREFGASVRANLAGLDPLPPDRNPYQRAADLEAEVERLRGDLRKILEVAGCDGSAPGLLTLIKQVAADALRGAR